MDKEINKIIAKLEGCFGIFDYLLTPVENNLLVSYIKNLQQENTRLKEVIEEVKDKITIKLGRYINEKDYVIDDVALDELLQRLEDKEVSE